MAITKELNDFLKGLGIEADKLKEALTSEDEVKINFNSKAIVTDEALSELKEKVKSEGYNDGKIAGVEMAVKSAKDKYGLNFEGKSIDAFADNFKQHVLSEAKAPTDKKVKELSESLENLQKKYESDLGLKDQEINKISNQFSQLKVNNELIKHVPQNLVGVKPTHLAQLARTEFEFEFDEDGNFVAKKGGKVLKDTMEKTIPVSDVLASYAKQNEWLKQSSGGRHGGHNNESGSSSDFKSTHDVMAYLDKNKIDPMSAEGQKMLDDFNNKES